MWGITNHTVIYDDEEGCLFCATPSETLHMCVSKTKFTLRLFLGMGIEKDNHTH